MVEEIDVDQDSSPEDQQVPLNRFQKVNEEKKALAEEVKSLKDQSKKEQTLSDQEEAEKKASDYISKKVEERLEAREKKQKETEDDEQKKFEEDVTEILDVFTDVKRKDFLKFIEDNDEEMEFVTVKAAMATYRKINDLSKEAEDKVKDDLDAKPSLPKNEGVKAETPPDDSNKTLQEIVNEEVAKLDK